MLKAEPVEAPINLTELKSLLAKADPGAVLVPPRILRRVIKHNCRLTGIGLQVPHRKSYVIGREALFQIASREELGLEPNRDLPQTVLLLGRPDAERLAALTRGDALLKYWRLLFHSRIHAALEQRLADLQLTQAIIRERIGRIGQAEFDEIRSVLSQENFLLPPRDDAAVYVEFCALYLELQYFASTLLPRYFPTLRDRHDVESILEADVPADPLFVSTRPIGAPDPIVHTEEAAELSAAKHLPAPEPLPPQRARAIYRKLCSKADQVAARGNLVRAAILRQRAAGTATDQLAAATRAAARADLDRLAGRLAAALELGAAEAEDWRSALPALLQPASRGLWPVEARLLYDLQKACVDHEREIYALDLVEWFVSFGSRPVKRLLPNHRAVLMAKHCRSAANRLAAARLGDAERKPLGLLLHQAVDRSEDCLRSRLRPLVGKALEQVGLAPHNFPERVARNKLIEELLDLTVERGFLTMGDLRDAVSRNNLKLPDLSGPHEFFAGDRLIRTNRRFAVALDGVYRRGEIYLRWLQRLSSLLFATGPGRFLTRFILLPYGVAYVALEGGLHMVNPVLHWTHQPRIHPGHEATGLTVALLGTFLLALFHIGVFRSQVLRRIARPAPEAFEACLLTCLRHFFAYRLCDLF